MSDEIITENTTEEVTFEKAAPVANATGPGRFDIFHVLEPKCLATNDSSHIQPVHCTNRNKDQQDVPPENYHQQYHEKHEGQRVNDIDNAHHHAICRPAVVTRNRPVTDANQQADQCRHNSDKQ